MAKTKVSILWGHDFYMPFLKMSKEVAKFTSTQLPFEKVKH
jgi:hypothetical protein